MKTINNKMTKQNFKLRKEIKGHYVAEGYHNGKHWEVKCENTEFHDGFAVDVYCDGVWQRESGGVDMRLKDVRWQLANNRDWFLGED